MALFLYNNTFRCSYIYLNELEIVSKNNKSKSSSSSICMPTRNTHEKKLPTSTIEQCDQDHNNNNIHNTHNTRQITPKNTRSNMHYKCSL